MNIPINLRIISIKLYINQYQSLKRQNLKFLKKNLLYLILLLFVGCSDSTNQHPNSHTTTRFLNFEITYDHEPINSDGWSPGAVINSKGTIAAVFEKADRFGKKYLYLRLKKKNIKISHSSDIKNPSISVLDDDTFLLSANIHGPAKSANGFQKIDPCILHFDQDGKMINWIPNMNAFSFSHQGVIEFLMEVVLGEKSIIVLYKARENKNKSNLIRIKYDLGNHVATEKEYIKIIGKENSDIISATLIDNKVQTVTRSYTTPLKGFSLFDDNRSYSAEIFSFNIDRQSDSMSLPEPSFVIDTTNRLDIQRVVKVNNNGFIVMHRHHDKGGYWKDDTFNYLKLKPNYNIDISFGFQGRIFQMKKALNINDFAVDEKYLYLISHTKNKNDQYITKVIRYDLISGAEIEYDSIQPYVSFNGNPWINDAIVIGNNLKFVSVYGDKVYEYNFNINSGQFESDIW